MNEISPIGVSQARLPQSYANAKTALADCVSIDECQTWADKAAALASYAKQAKDEELMRMSIRIRDRAIRRAGELLKQIEPQNKGGDRKSDHGEVTHTVISRADAAREAGMSKHQQVQAVRVANVPAEQFEKLVESPTPPTVTKLAAMGTVPAPRPVLDLKGRDPREFNRSMHFVALIKEYAKEIGAADLELILPGLIEKEAALVRSGIAEIDAIHDRIITRI